MELLIEYCKKNGLDIVRIKEGKDPNPFPVGRTNLYAAYRGLKISEATRLKIIDYIRQDTGLDGWKYKVQELKEDIEQANIDISEAQSLINEINSILK